MPTIDDQHVRGAAVVDIAENPRKLRIVQVKAFQSPEVRAFVEAHFSGPLVVGF